MAVVNELPKKGGKEPVLTFVGGGWKQASGGNSGGISKNMYVDTEYWSGGGIITCKKAFSALVVLITQNSTDVGNRSRRTLYTQGGDIVDTGTVGYGQANVLYEFNVGDTVTGYQNNATTGNTIGCAMIYDINPR